MRKAAGFSVMLAGYGLLWRLATPLLARHARLRDNFALRRVPQSWQPPFAADLWIQAASGGESFLVRQLLAQLDSLAGQTSQGLRILCTSCTRQGLEVLGAAREHGRGAWKNLDIAVRVFPLDEPETMSRARDYAAPRAVVLLETELWPGLMSACTEKNIPLLTINGRMTAKSLAGYRYLVPLWTRAAPTAVLAMDAADAARFAVLFGPERVRVMPNMKFDGVPEHPPVPEPDSPVMRLLVPGLPVILLASVRREEEALLLPVLASLRRQVPEALLVVAPRHMERVLAWREMLGAHFGPQGVALASELLEKGRSAAPGTALIWDSFGQLSALYARAKAVFVGGSLAPLGGQNFLEAAGQGRIPVIGPYWKNFAWVGEDFFTAGLGRQVPDAAALAPALVDLLRHSPDPALVRERLAAYITPRRGGTRMAAAAVWELLDRGGRGAESL